MWEVAKQVTIRIFACRVQAPRIYDTVESGSRVAVQGFRCLTDCEFRPRERHFCGKRLVLILSAHARLIDIVIVVMQGLSKTSSVG